MLELDDAGIRSREAPVDRAAFPVALLLPGPHDFPPERVPRSGRRLLPRHCLAKTLSSISAPCSQPTAVFGRVVDHLLQALGEAFGLLGLEGFVQGGGRVGV